MLGGLTYTQCALQRATHCYRASQIVLYRSGRALQVGQSGTTPAGSKPGGTGVTAAGSNATKAGTTAGTSNVGISGGGGGSGGGGMVRKAELGAEELAAKDGVGQGAQHRCTHCTFCYVVPGSAGCTSWCMMNHDAALHGTASRPTKQHTARPNSEHWLCVPGAHQHGTTSELGGGGMGGMGTAGAVAEHGMAPGTGMSPGAGVTSGTGTGTGVGTGMATATGSSGMSAAPQSANRTGAPLGSNVGSTGTGGRRSLFFHL